MATIPKHFEEAFPWITQPTSTVKIIAPRTKWIEEEIIRIIFRVPDKEDEDFRPPFIKSLGTIKKDKQVSYINAAAKCLAEAAIATTLPTEKQVWYEEVHNLARKLILHLKSEPKKSYPPNWSNLFTLFLSVIENSNTASSPEQSEMSKSVEKMKRSLVMRADIHSTHGILDLVAILNLISQESLALAKGKNAMAFYKLPQTFFKEISINSTLCLEYQRKALKAIAPVNQEHFGKPFNALTSHILTCLLNKPITQQNLVSKSKKTKPKAK